MAPKEAKQLSVGAVVVWESSGERGKVTEKGEAGLRVTWDDGQVATYLYAAQHCGLAHVQKAVR